MPCAEQFLALSIVTKSRHNGDELVSESQLQKYYRHGNWKELALLERKLSSG